MAQPLVDDELWAIVEPLLPKSKRRRKRYPGRQTPGASASVERHLVCPQVGNSLGDVAEGDGLRLRHELLAILARVAGGWRVGSLARSAAHALTRGRQDRFFPRDCRQLQCARGARGEKTGPNPTDRRKAGSKHHLLSDAQGIPLSIILTEANRHDVTQLLPLLDAIPSIAGKPG